MSALQMVPVVENDYEEPEETQTRVGLGLRPTFYRKGANEDPHPDTRPCPSWCYIAEQDDWDHEVDRNHPMTATHSLGNYVSTVASLYAGEWSHRIAGEPCSYVNTAEINSNLEQLGQGEPFISTWLSIPGKPRKKRLKLTPHDARELARALNALADLADPQVVS